MADPLLAATGTSPPSGRLGPVLLMSSVAAIGGFLFGFDSSVINGTVVALAGAFGTNAAGTGFAIASALLGCAVGAFFAGAFADKIGRRPTMLWCAVFFTLSAIATGAVSNAPLFIAARILGGVAVGAASVLAPMYISEVSPPHLRGRLASLQQLAIVLGIFIAFLSNYALGKLAGGAEKDLWFGLAAWRWMYWMEAVPCVAFLIGIMLVPESPRFLIAAGRRDEALHVFQRISAEPDSLVRQVEESLRGEHRPRMSDIIDKQTGRVAKLVWVGIGLAAFQQFVGINIIFYFGEVLWRVAGATEESALRINLLSGFINIVATLLAIALIDRWGRKPLLISGAIGMAVTLGAMAVIFASASTGPDGKPVLEKGPAIAAIVAANLYIIAFGISWGPVVWVLLGEMFPNRMRGAALALSGASNWIANFLVTVTFLPLAKYAGLVTAYGLYAASAVIGFIFVARLVRETKGKTLEDMK